MNLEKLFGSKTKVDILKYLIFRRQGISMRALETEIGWTFPAIKKQIEVLNSAEIIDINKDKTGRSIYIKPEFLELFKDLFFKSLQQELSKRFLTDKTQIHNYFWGDKFGIPIGMDIIIIHEELEKSTSDTIKNDINEIFREYRIESASIVFMSKNEWDKRYRLADRFVLQVMRFYNNIK